MIPHIKPPFVLWIKGNKDIFVGKHIGLMWDEKNKHTIQELKNILGNNANEYKFVLPSWHESSKTIRADLKRIHILNKEIKSNIKPEDNELYVTEYPPIGNLGAIGYEMPNRLFAAFLESLVIINSKKSEEFDNLISNVIGLGKEIYCLEPKDGDEANMNINLIKGGANIFKGLDKVI